MKEKLTKEQWLNELAEFLQQNVSFKDLSIEQVLNAICVETSIEDGYNEGISPEDYALESILI